MHVLKLWEDLNAKYSTHIMDNKAVLNLSFRPVWDGVNLFTKKANLLLGTNKVSELSVSNAKKDINTAQSAFLKTNIQQIKKASHQAAG